MPQKRLACHAPLEERARMAPVDVVFGEAEAVSVGGEGSGERSRTFAVPAANQPIIVGRCERGA